MSVTTLARPARRMEWIPEEHQAAQGKIGIGCGDLGRDSPAHGLPADKQRLTRGGHFVSNPIDDRSITGLEQGCLIWHPATLLCIEEVERDDVDALPRDRFREIDHESALLTRTGAVPENERGAGGTSGGVHESRRASAWRDLDGQPSWSIGHRRFEARLPFSDLP
jgi:hypothetical protein